MDAAAAEPKPAAEGGVGERLLAAGTGGGGGKGDRERERERPRRPDDDGGGGLGLRCNEGFGVRTFAKYYRLVLCEYICNVFCHWKECGMLQFVEILSGVEEKRVGSPLCYT